MKVRLAAQLLLALAILAPPAASAAPVRPRDRAEMVAGWRISSGGSGDGGYVARLSRRGRGWAYEHYLEYWRGNGGVVLSDEFRRGRCRSGDASAIVPFELGTSRSSFDQRLADYLRECPLPRAEAAALRRSLARAWPHFLRHARRARAALDAELAWIARGSPAR
ncbi:MAG TPA: hypothetical protein VEC11_08060 [Allosphingosinicella sp.]|nr:hypothetical protein [Allosphingosinicella sp.]